MRTMIVVLIVLASASMACNLGPAQRTSIAARPTTTIIIAQTSTPPNTPTSQSGNPTAAQPAPTINNCTPRTDWPVYTVVSGDTLVSLAVRTGSAVDILFNANCLTNADVLTVGQPLRVPMMPAPLPTPISNNCPGNIPWFFTFKTGIVEPLCPQPVENREAVGQDFEGGRMLWYGNLPTDSDQRPTIWIIYNDGDWETFPDVWNESQPSNASDPALAPPPNRYQPVRGFGKIWRENIRVRQRLGWAYEPEISFAGRFQSVVEPNPRPSGYSTHWYMDHGKAGIVLRLYSIDMAPNRWELAGTYPH